jgi:hypothetical protein
LVNNGVLEAIDFIDFSTYINYIKEKKTNKFKKGIGKTSNFFLYRLCTLLFMVFMMHPLIVRNISLPLLITIYDICISIFYE